MDRKKQFGILGIIVFLILLAEVLIVSRSPSIALEQRMRILDKYNVQYFLTADAAIQEFYAHSPDLFNIQNFDGYWIVEFGECL